MSGVHDTPLAAFRQRMFRIVCSLTPLFVLPAAWASFRGDRHLLALVLAVAGLTSLVNAVSMRGGRVAMVPMPAVFAPILLSLVLGLAQVGTAVGFWVFPVIMLFSVLGEARTTRALVIVSGVILVPVALASLETTDAVRFTVPLLISLVVYERIADLAERMQAQLLRLATTDPLTGLLNRRELDERLALAIDAEQRGLGNCAVVLIDIDHFKRINDTLGHAAGDDALKAVAAVIRTRARQTDTVFRTGGEEFLVLTRNVDAHGAEALADSLRAAVESTPIVEGGKVTISAGVARWRPTEPVSRWVARADEALYGAKRAGRNRVAVADGDEVNGSA